MSTDQSIFTYCLTCCGLTCFSALDPWCNTKRYGCGSGGCGGQRGFCGACFDRGFNADSWDGPDEEEQQGRVTKPKSEAAPPAIADPGASNAETATEGQPPETTAYTEKVIQSEQPEAVSEMKTIP